MKFSRPSHTIFGFYKRSKTGVVEGLGMRLSKGACDLYALYGWQNSNLVDVL